MAGKLHHETLTLNTVAARWVSELAREHGCPFPSSQVAFPSFTACGVSCVLGGKSDGDNSLSLRRSVSDCGNLPHLLSPRPMSRGLIPFIANPGSGHASRDFVFISTLPSMPCAIFSIAFHALWRYSRRQMFRSKQAFRCYIFS